MIGTEQVPSASGHRHTSSSPMRTKLTPNRITCRGHLGLGPRRHSSGASRAAASYWKLASPSKVAGYNALQVAAAVARVAKAAPQTHALPKPCPHDAAPRGNTASVQVSKLRSWHEKRWRLVRLVRSGQHLFVEIHPRSRCL